MAIKFQDLLTNEKEKINTRINLLFDDVIKAEEEPYLRNFYNFDKDFVLRGGRRLLPITLVNTFKGIASEKDLIEKIDDVYDVSIAIEMLHISSMIVDDLIGKEDLRRGMPTFHLFMKETLDQSIRKDSEIINQYEEAAAVYGGILTSFLGTQVISKSQFDENRRTKAILLYQKGIQGVTRGHLLNESYKVVPLEKISLENYIILAGLKRGKQMETAVGLGAILGNARQSQIEPLMQAMNKLGIIDQLINDINGSFGDPKKKSINSDIKNGQCTILTTIAYQSASPEQKKILNEVLGNSQASEEQVEKVREIFKSTNAVDFAKYYANSLKNDAYNLLVKSVYPGLRQDVMDFFENLLTYIINYQG